MAPKRDRVTVDAEEYRALVHLRDIAHEDVKLRLVASEARYQDCLAINREQVARLARQDMELCGARAQLSLLRQQVIDLVPRPAAPEQIPAAASVPA